MKRSSLVIAAILALCALSGGLAEGLEFKFNGPRWNFALLGGIPLPAGADIEFRYPVLETGLGPTALVLRTAGGFEDKRFLRDAVTGDPKKSDEESADIGSMRFNSLNFQWDLGLLQGLIPGDSGNLAEAFAYYRGRFDANETSLPATAFADLGGSLNSSFIAGAAWKGVGSDSRRVKEGLAGEVSAEWGPGFLNPVGDGSLDFLRLNAKGECFLPILSYGQESNPELNLFSLYAGAYASLDWATGADKGSDIPFYVLQSFGGRTLRKTLGDSVRGYPDKGYDSGLKGLVNLDLRAVGPALFGQEWFVPIVYGFFDAGFYAGLPGASAAYRDASGLIASTGGGFALDLFDFAFLGLKVFYLLPIEDPLFDVYAKDRIGYSIEFALHF